MLYPGARDYGLLGGFRESHNAVFIIYVQKSYLANFNSPDVSSNIMRIEYLQKSGAIIEIFPKLCTSYSCYLIQARWKIRHDLGVAEQQ